jgi:hypothetical protein
MPPLVPNAMVSTIDPSVHPNPCTNPPGVSCTVNKGQLHANTCPWPGKVASLALLLAKALHEERDTSVVSLSPEDKSGAIPSEGYTRTKVSPISSTHIFHDPVVKNIDSSPSVSETIPSPIDSNPSPNVPETCLSPLDLQSNSVQDQTFPHPFPSPNAKKTTSQPNPLDHLSPKLETLPYDFIFDHNSNTTDQKRKPTPNSPISHSKKPRTNPPTVERTYFEPEMVTIIPQSQLNHYLKSQRLKKLVRQQQFGGYHLPLNDPIETSSTLNVSMAEEAGLIMPLSIP